MTLRKDSVKRRNGSAALPAFTAAMPMAKEITSSCRAPKLRETSPSLKEAPRPMKLLGSMDCRNAVHEPTCDGSAAVAASTDVPTPGLSTSATRMPAITEKNAVMANHTSVDMASEAALVTLRRFATEVTTAAKMSGGTMTLSSWTYAEPMPVSVVVSQLASSSARPASMPDAMKPTIRPMIRPAMTCAPKPVAQPGSPRLASWDCAFAVVVLLMGSSFRQLCRLLNRLGYKI